MSRAFVLGFTGAYLDSVTGGYPLGNGYRWYLSGLMRFNVPDGFSPFGSGGINPYIYCAGDPINRSDPSGHVPVSSLETGLVEDATIAAKDAVRATSAGSTSGYSSGEYEELFERRSGSSDRPSQASQSNWEKIKSKREPKPTFQNWVWVERGKVARSSAPSYFGDDLDSSQNMTQRSIQVLKSEKITRVVALISQQLPPEQIDALNQEGIEYLWLNVHDFGAPSVQQLREGSEFIESNSGATLVHCGYGRGRTGAQISAWEIYSGRKTVEEAIRTTTAEENEQKAVLRLVTERQRFP